MNTVNLDTKVENKLNELKDKIKQGSYKVNWALDELKFCESILYEKKCNDEKWEKTDCSDDFYLLNEDVLNKLFNINVRMAITDMFILVREKECNSCYKINNFIKSNFKNKIDNYVKILEYIKQFEQELKEYDLLIDDLVKLRLRFVAHVDNKKKRDEYIGAVAPIAEMLKLVKFLYAYYINMDSLINHNYESLINSNEITDGFANTFEKMSKFYKKHHIDYMSKKH